jgi:hypothetical protein
MPPKRKTPPTDAHAGPSRRDRDHSRDSSRQISRETGVGSGDGDRTTSRRDRAGYWAVAGGDVEWGWNTQPRQPHPQSHSQSEQSQSVSQSQSQQSVLQSQQQQEQDDPAVSALELMYRWLEVPGHWVRFREARAGAERQAVAQLCSDWLDENDTPVPRSWNECEAKVRLDQQVPWGGVGSS